MNPIYHPKNFRLWAMRARMRGRGGRITVGSHTYGVPKVSWWGEDANLEIGRYCSIADGVEIFLGGNHRSDWITTFPFSEFPRHWPEARGHEGHPSTKGDVTIGNDVWICSGATILSGVRVGHGAVIGARALVTHDVPPYAIVGGNPAKIIRMRFREDQVARLLAAEWWSWSPETVKARLPALMSSDVERFLANAPSPP